MIFRSLAAVAALAAFAPSARGQAPAETMIAVEASLKGAPARDMTRQVTAKLESFLRADDGLKFSFSLTRDGQSWIFLKFKPGIDGTAATRRVHAQLARARPELPPAVGEPTAVALPPESTPIALLAFSSGALSPLDVSNYVDQRPRGAFDAVPGISEVRVYGFHAETLELRLDPSRLAAYGVSLRDVEATLQQNNVVLGSPRKLDDALVLPIVDRFRLTPERLLDLVVKTVSGAPIRVSDLGRATLGSKFDGTHVTFDGVPAVLVVIYARAGADPVAITRALRERIADIEISRPAAIALKVGYACELCAAPGAR